MGRRSRPRSEKGRHSFIINKKTTPPAHGAIGKDGDSLSAEEAQWFLRTQGHNSRRRLNWGPWPSVWAD